MSFHWLDLVLVIGIGVSAVYATMRGFVRETLSIIAWVVAVLAALYFGPDIADTLKPHLPSGLGDIAGYLLVFLSVLLLLSFVTYHLSGSVKRSPVGPVDRVLGCLFGVVRGLAVAGIVYLLVAAVEPPSEQPNWMTKAELYPLVRHSGEMLDRLIPDRLLKHGSKTSHPTDAKSAKAPQPDRETPAPAVAAPAPTAASPHKKSNARADTHETYTPEPTQPVTLPARPTVLPAPVSSAPTQAEHIEKHKETAATMQADTQVPAPMPQKRPGHATKNSAEKQDNSATKAADTKHRKSAYGEKDREALDKLIEESGKRNSGKP